MIVTTITVTNPTIATQQVFTLTTIGTGFTVNQGGGGGGGVTDHGMLTGLGDDDHTQYLNNARGDVRYQALNAAAGGDLSGNYPNPTVIKVQGVDFQGGAPTNNDVWIYSTAAGKYQHRNIVKVDVGLDQVDNTRDVDKPISTATSAALAGKQALDADLTAIAALTGIGFAKRTGVDTWTLDGNSYYLSSNPSGYTANTGTVTSFTFTNGSGFTGTVSNSGTTPTLSLTLQNASSTQAGQLSSTDWNTFNNKQPAGSYLTGNQTITFTGDATGSGATSVSLTIANSAVTFAKIQNINTNKLLGRSTASAGVVEELSIGSGLSLTSGVLSATGGGGATTDLTNQSSNPSTPAAGHTTLFSKIIANKPTLSVIDENGLADLMQSALWDKPLVAFIAGFNNGGFSSYIGATSGLNQSINGDSGYSSSSRAYATTSIITKTPRFGLSSSATAGTMAYFRDLLPQFLVGDGTAGSGFFYSTKFAITDASLVSGKRFIGLQYNISPWSSMNSLDIYMGCRAGDTTWKIKAGSATEVDLGANFPCNTTGVDIYSLQFYSPISPAGMVYYRVERINTGNVATGSFSSVGLSSAMGPVAYVHNGATALAASIDVGTTYISRA